jgi:hypothetical protein
MKTISIKGIIQQIITKGYKKRFQNAVTTPVYNIPITECNLVIVNAEGTVMALNDPVESITTICGMDLLGK